MKTFLIAFLVAVICIDKAAAQMWCWPPIQVPDGLNSACLLSPGNRTRVCHLLKNTHFFMACCQTKCFGSGHSLACYYCENEPSNWNCMSMKKCAESDNFCTTIKTTTRIGNGQPDDYRISKRCTPTCAENFMETGASSVVTKCCQFSLCNISGATSVKISGMVLVIGILASFLYIFQSG